LGVTHLLWKRSSSINREITVAGELVFFDFALHETRNRKDFDDKTVAEMPKKRPRDRLLGMVAYLGCSAKRLMSIKDVNAMVAADSPDRRSGDMPADAVAALVARADFVVADQRCLANAKFAGFAEAPRWGDLHLWVRDR
jgi:hypothetical protein